MSIIPTVKCRSLSEAIGFYTQVLDFTLAEPGAPQGDPGFAILRREGHEVHLSSHGGDGVYGSNFVVLVKNADTLFRKFLARGLDVSGKEQSEVHQGPVNQSWGTREFYVDDPSGNTVRFVQR
jgi:catechol 2,3-dioxygenase-like lactoylglutathione lyase family enzyme